MDTDGAGDNAHDVLGELPVLLVQTMNAFAIVSQEPRIQTKISSVVCFVVRIIRATLHPDAPAALELSIARTRVLDYL